MTYLRIAQVQFTEQKAMCTLCSKTVFIFINLKSTVNQKVWYLNYIKVWVFFFHNDTLESSKNLNCFWIIVFEVIGFNCDGESCAAASCQWRPAGVSLDVPLVPLSIRPFWAPLGGFLFLKTGTLKCFLGKITDECTFTHQPAHWT